MVGKGIPFQDALKKADEVLLHATSGISTIISGIGMINVDFADVRTVMKDGGAALMGTGIGRGDNRAMEAAQQAISSPLLDNVSISGATGVLLNMTGGQDLSIGEVTRDRRDHPRRRPATTPRSSSAPCRSRRCRARSASRWSPPGFGKALSQATPSHALAQVSTGTPVIPIDGGRPRPVIGSAYQGQSGSPAARSRRGVPRRSRRPSAVRRPDLDDLEIPTFIRRQMD